MEFDALSRNRWLSGWRFILLVRVSLMLSCLDGETALGADDPGTPSHDADIQEVVRVANKYITHGPCEASRADPSVVATMSPYSADVAAGRTAAEYAVLWSGDIDCSGGSGTNTMNFLLIEKRGSAAATIVGVGSIEDAANIQRIVAVTSDSLTLDVYTFGPDDPTCCPNRYERWTLHREAGAQKGRYTLKKVDSKTVQPVPLQPGEKRLPTARSDQ